LLRNPLGGFSNAYFNFRKILSIVSEKLLNLMEFFGISELYKADKKSFLKILDFAIKIFSSEKILI
jgi:hypothetical protein